MVCMELDLACQAPHDLVLLDGSFGSLVIYLNQALTKIADCAPDLAAGFLDRWHNDMFDKLMRVLRSDHIVAVPKFTSRNELVRDGELCCPVPVDGKTLATMILQARRIHTARSGPDRPDPVVPA